MSNTLKKCKAIEDLLGRQTLKGILERHLEDGRTHVFLLEGSQGVGKKTCARAFACALLGVDAQALSEHPDFTELKLAPKEKFYRVDALREKVTGDVSLSPRLGTRRVFLLDLDLTTEAGQNILLKSLEEPPGFAYFLLTSSKREHVLDTLRSRSLSLQVPGLTAQECRRLWEEHPAWKNLRDRDRLFLEKYAKGNPGRGFAILEDEGFFPYVEKMEGLLLQWMKNRKSLQPGALLRSFQPLMQEEGRQELFVDLLEHFVHILLFLALDVPRDWDLMWPALEEGLRRTDKVVFRPEALQTMAREAEEARRAILFHVQADVALTHYLLQVREELANA